MQCLRLTLLLCSVAGELAAALHAPVALDRPRTSSILICRPQKCGLCSLAGGSIPYRAMTVIQVICTLLACRSGHWTKVDLAFHQLKKTQAFFSASLAFVACSSSASDSSLLKGMHSRCRDTYAARQHGLALLQPWMALLAQLAQSEKAICVNCICQLWQRPKECPAQYYGQHLH